MPDRIDILIDVLINTYSKAEFKMIRRNLRREIIRKRQLGKNRIAGLIDG